LSEAGRAAVCEILTKAGSKAIVEAPLAWLRFEPRERSAPEADVRLTTWPGGEERLLATAGYHGQYVRWLQNGRPR
jgi:hypothetical protein